MTPAVSGFISGIGPMEMLLILVIALLLFGNRLPEVARIVGKGYLEFRRNLKDLESQIDLEGDPGAGGGRRKGPEPKALPPAEPGGVVVQDPVKPDSAPKNDQEQARG